MTLRANTCIIITMALLWCVILVPTGAKAEVSVAARLTAQNKIDLKRVEDYLKSLSTLKSRFLQTSSDGSIASGKLFMSRPGNHCRMSTKVFPNSSRRWNSLGDWTLCPKSKRSMKAA